MILSTLIFGCAAALVAAQTASNPAVRTDGGQLVLLSSEDVLIEDTAPGSVRGDRIGLLASMRAMASDIANLRYELSTEVSLATLPSPPSPHA